MSTPWLGLLQLLFSLALFGPYVDPAARLLAGLAACMLPALHRSRWKMLCAATVLGTVCAIRLGAVQGAAGADQAQVVRFQVVRRLDERRVVAWVALADRAPQRWVLSGIPSGLGPSSRGTAEVVALPVLSRRNPDDGDGRRRLLGHGAHRRGYARRGSVEVLRRGRTPWMERLRQKVAGRWKRLFGANAPLWEALLLGDRTDLGRDLSQSFARLGLAHLLALSGLHVGIVVGVLLWPLRRWGRRAVLWVSPWLVAWALLAGMSSSLYRAVAMLLWWAVGRRLARPTPILDGLAMVAVLELVARPTVSLSVGWWLSYAATAAILRGAGLWGRWPRLPAAIAVSCAAQAATLPWTLGVFGRVALLSPLLLLGVGPLFAVVLVVGGIAACVGLLVPLPGLRLILAVAGHGFGLALALAARWMPEPYGHPGIHGTSWALALCALGLLLPPWPRAARLRVLCAALLVAGAHLPLLHRARASWVTLDVGQGDAAVYRAGSRTLVVDAGPRARDYDAGRWVVLPYLARRNLRGVDLLLTHGHLDHFGGARALLGSGRVARVLVAACDSSRDWVADLRDRCAEQGARLAYLTRGDTLRYRPWPLPCLWPDAEAGWRSANSRSLVLAVGAPRARLLATGDLERDAERELLRESPTLLGNVAVLKVGHHGGNTGTDAAWLRAMEPHPVALISCGRNNRYHHPHPEVLARLRGVEARTLRTDVSGAIEIFWDPRGRPSWRSAR